MSIFDKLTSKVQDTAAATKLITTLQSGNQIRSQALDAFIKKDFPRLIALVESVLSEENNSKKADAYFTLGSMCLSGKNYDLAEECLQKSLEIEPSGKIYELLGDIYYNTDKLDKSLEALNNCLEMQFESEDIYLTLIKVYRKNKDYLNLMDMIWKYIQKYNKPDWAWQTKAYLFDHPSWSGYFNLKTPGASLCFVLREIMKNEKPSKTIELSETLSSKPFPIFTSSIEKGAYHWIRAVCYTRIRIFGKSAEEWYKFDQLPKLPPEIKKWANAEWRASELAGHFDPEILSRIYQREETAVKGQFMKATILICDIRGFSRFSYEFRHAPQVVLQFLQPYFDNSQDIIISQKGVLDKYLGDGFISFFIPEAQDEDGYSNSIIRAVNTSIELQKYFNEKLPEWSDIWKRNLDETTHYQKLVDHVGLGIGIHTGFVFLGEVGTGKRRQYTVLGNVVNFTARLQGKAARDHIVFSAPIYEYIKNSDLGFSIQEMPEDEYSDLKNIPGSYKLYFINYKE